MSGTTDAGDDWVRQLLASHDVGPMPDDVLARLEQAMARVAAEQASPAAPPAAPGLVPPPAAPGAAARLTTEPTAPTPARATGSTSAASAGAAPGPHGSRRERRREEASDRRRLLGRRLLPVAAGVVVLGLGAVTFDQLLGDDQQDAALSETASDSSAAGAAPAPAPRGLVATGTDYTSSDLAVFEQQIADLVEVATGEVVPKEAPRAEALEQPGAGQADSAPQEADGVAGSGPAPDAAEVRRALPETPLSDPEAYSRCATEVTDGDDVDPLAIDLATVDGIERAVVVVPDRNGEGVFVFVTDPDCDVSTGLEFYPMTPDITP